MDITYNVQNSPSASDISLSDRQLSILGSPTMNYPLIGGVVVTRSQPERVQVRTVTWTNANTTTFRFEVSQLIGFGNLKTEVINYTSTSTATSGGATEISVNLKRILDAYGFQFTVAITSTTKLTITAAAGYPLFNLGGVSNVTVAEEMPTIAPSGTANLAITSVIAPDGTAATAIAGTTTVTVTTLAAHGLNIGDQVTIAGVATMTINGASSGTFYVATVPTSTTFTLADCLGAGGANSGTITINTVNTVIVNTLAAHGLTAGDHVTIASIATMTVNGGASFTGRVRTVVSTTQFYIDEVTNNGSLNSGTITITTVAQTETGLGTALTGITGITSGNTYTLFDFNFAANSAYLNLTAQSLQLNAEHKLYVNEGASGYQAYYTKLNEKIAGYLAFSTDFDQNTVTL